MIALARNREARELTEKHRLGQIALGAETASVVEDVLGLIDLADIDGSSVEWYAVMTRITENGYGLSQAMAADYYRDFAWAEASIREGQVVRPLFPADRVVEDLRVKGPVAVKTAIGRGMAPEAALASVITSLQGETIKHVLAGGRDLIDQTVRYKGRRGGYRRVTDGKPCAFCAMLASRGPVYSQETAYFRSHGSCGCNAEPVYHDWVPTDREALWRASYRQAAMDASDSGSLRVAPKPGSDQEDTILWRMRRNSPGLFSDGVYQKKK